jgi:cytochrome b6-f complex iron-sulfur subunit
LTEDSFFSEKQNRRDFLNWVLGLGFFGWLAAVLYPIYSYLNPPKAPEVDVSNLEIAKVSEVPDNSSKMFKMGNKPGILIRTPDGQFRAFSAVCTHLDCTVQYKPDEKLIWCACHNGRYDLNGKNISGPPPAPLTPYKLTIKNDEIFVSK